MSDRNHATGSFSAKTRTLAVVAALAAALSAGPVLAESGMPAVTPPQPTVPEYFTMLGQYVRVAYNNEGFATLGYRMAQYEIGREWMMLLVGVTLRKPTPDFDLKRDAFTVRTPDGKVIPLATQTEYAAANLGALNKRASVVRDSIDYFPPEADQPCGLSFFAEAGRRGPNLSYDEVEVTSRRACAGRLYFKIPGGIQVGQHWLDIKFAGSTVQVPFRTLTKDEEKQLEKHWEDLKKQHEANLGR